MTKEYEIHLSKEQKECVDYDSGDLLIRGIAGSGKSVVILKRALKQYEESKGRETIKVFSYTNTLVRYTDELLTKKLGERGIEVTTVDSYFFRIYNILKTAENKGRFVDDIDDSIIQSAIIFHRKVNKQPHRYYEVPLGYWAQEFKWIMGKGILTVEDYIAVERRGRGTQVRVASERDRRVVWELYQLTRDLMKKRKIAIWEEMYLYIIENASRIPENWKIDYVFVDEAQDMTLAKMKALNLIKRKAITIAADIAQKIYDNSFTWKETGIDIRGRASKSLKKTFRSTKQIVRLAEDLADINRRESSMKDEMTEAVYPEVDGGRPLVWECANQLAELDAVIKVTKKLTEENAEDTIGIICKKKKQMDDVCEQLRVKGIPFQRIEKEAEWKMLDGGVKVVTALSAKGLEFDHALIPFVDLRSYPFSIKMDDPEMAKDNLIKERCILYVAITRGRSTVSIFYDKRNKSPFIDELRRNHYEKVIG